VGEKEPTVQHSVSEKRRRGILAGLVAVHVILHCLALAAALEGVLVPTGRPFADVFVRAACVVLPSQATVLAFWVVLGGGRFPWRVIPAAVGVAIYAFCLFPSGRYIFEVVAVLQACASGLFLFVARLTGLELVRASASGGTSRPPWLSVRGALIWVAVVAVLIALYFLPLDSDGIRIVLSIFGSLSIGATASLYCSFGKGWLAARVFILLVTVGVGAQWLEATVPFVYAGPCATLLGFADAWLVGTFVLIRLAGYDLVWGRRGDSGGNPGTRPHNGEGENGVGRK
jgi:hypothetical protein